MVNYPNGRPYVANEIPHTSQKKITYGSRGMSLEERINQSNQYYLSHNIAVIHKKPTPVQVVEVHYPKRSAAKITEAYYRQASTTDYNGIYQGKYIDFEAKETKNKTRFPLSNLLEHQMTHMKQCHEQGGIVFLILSFKIYKKVFVLPFEDLEHFIQTHTEKSIPLEYIEKRGIECPLGAFPYIDYLQAVDQIILYS